MSDTKKILHNMDLNGTSRIIGLQTPVAPDEPAPKSYVDGLIEGLAWKDNCQAGTTGNINLNSPGATIDGVAMSAGWRVLVRQQTLPQENGIYIWSGSSSAMSRANDANTADELLNAVTAIDAGTSLGGTRWRQTAIDITLGTTPLPWEDFGSAVPNATTSVRGTVILASQAEVNAGSDASKPVTPATLAGTPLIIKRYETQVGNGTDTVFTVTHNLNSRSLSVDIIRVASPYDKVEANIEFTTVNTLTVTFTNVPTSNQFNVVVKR